MTPSDNYFTISPHNLALLHSTLLHSYPVPLNEKQDWRIVTQSLLKSGRRFRRCPKPTVDSPITNKPAGRPIRSSRSRPGPRQSPSHQITCPLALHTHYYSRSSIWRDLSNITPRHKKPIFSDPNELICYVFHVFWPPTQKTKRTKTDIIG